jgi:hypothetical protein
MPTVPLVAVVAGEELEDPAAPTIPPPSASPTAAELVDAADPVATMEPLAACVAVLEEVAPVPVAVTSPLAACVVAAAVLAPVHATPTVPLAADAAGLAADAPSPVISDDASVTVPLAAETAAALADAPLPSTPIAPVAAP